MYIAVCHICHNYVCCILQWSTIVISILDVYYQYVVVVIPKLDCNALWFSLLYLVYIGVCCVFITMLDVNVSVLWFSRLCWLYNIVPYGCHGHVGCTLQCAAVIFTVYYIGRMVHLGVDVITLLDVYCVVP